MRYNDSRLLATLLGTRGIDELTPYGTPNGTHIFSSA